MRKPVILTVDDDPEVLHAISQDVRRAYERNDAVPELMAQMRKSKALDWLLHHVEMVDPDGNAIDRDLVLGHDEHDHDHDHADHDHDEAAASAENGDPES